MILLPKVYLIIKTPNGGDMKNLIKSFCKILFITLLVCRITDALAQNKCGFSLDTTANSKHLTAFLHNLDTNKFENYSKKKIYPRNIF